MLGPWKTSECAKWTIRKHNTYRGGMLLAEKYQEDYTERLLAMTDGEVTGPTLGEMRITTPAAFVIRIPACR